MDRLRIEICNERLLPRFGVDRLLVLLARRLTQAGHEVGFVCLRCDEAMLRPISTDVTVIPVAQGLNMEQTEDAVATAMVSRWELRSPNAVVIGGWPFFRLASQAGGHGVPSIFIDAGAVAQDSFGEPQLSIQRELRRIRQLTLRSIRRVLPISHFIQTTQSEPDRGSQSGVRTVLLGADHMALGTFGGDQQKGDGQDLVRRIEMGAASGLKMLLALGRFEARGYKNSAAVYDVFRAVCEHVPEARLLLLDAGEDCGVPADLSRFVHLLGAPDDNTLAEIMRLSAAGISTSLWEGFNLPIAEMQWLDRPAVAFSIGAHPEVIAEPWLLCQDTKEMASKLVSLLRGDGAPDLTLRFAAFRQRRQWEFTLDAWEEEIQDAAQERLAEVEVVGEPRTERRIVLVDVTNASLDPANPGVIRVVRRLCSELQREDRLELVFAGWSRDSGEFVFLDQTRRGFLEGYGGPKDGLSLLASWKGDITSEGMIARIRSRCSRPPVLLLPEVMFDERAKARIQWGRARGFQSATILYDLIPIYHSELCDPTVSSGFPSYLEAVAEADAVWSISEFTSSEFRRYLSATRKSLPRNCEAIHLPGQFGEQLRNPRLRASTSNDEIRMLMVATLEPRKNHIRLLEAYERLRKRRPELGLSLVLVGNRYAGAPEIAESVAAAACRDASIVWLGTVDDERLAAEFEKCDFTVYPSLVEGYGLPIVESLWMGRPCLAHDGGVMRELASEGGCLMADMTNPAAMEDALELLSTDRALLARLQAESLDREISTWRDYADEIANHLCSL